jgi:hypothetical protein
VTTARTGKPFKASRMFCKLHLSLEPDAAQADQYPGRSRLRGRFGAPCHKGPANRTIGGTL